MSGRTMPLMQLVTEFLLKGKELCKRLRSTEGTTLSKGDLQLLREQLEVLDTEAANLLEQKEERE
jgi:hypothetical protein